MPLILAIDEGTTGVRAYVFDEQANVRGHAYAELEQSFPRPGWVEQDPEMIWERTLQVCRQALEAARVAGRDLAALGICTQRSTTLVWERGSGKPVYPAIVWQDTRTAARVPELVAQGVFTNAMASASKLEWILDHVPGARGRAEQGALCFGTVDSWLLWNLCRGAVHATDHSNASCTTLYDPFSGSWHLPALEVLRIPASMLPQIESSSCRFGEADPSWFGAPVPVAALAGDQQAALFGELGWSRGAAKITLGTSAMADVHTGTELVVSSHGAYPLVLCSLAGERNFCLEGTAIAAGAAMQWLRDGLGVLGRLEDASPLAQSVPDAGGVWAVPAFQGLGTPHMDPHARAVIGGLSRASQRAHVVRALLEGIAFRCHEVLATLFEDAGLPFPDRLRVDGGAAANDFLLQQIANTIGRVVERPASLQASVLGAAYLAGLATGVWHSTDELAATWRSGGTFEPQWTEMERQRRYERWRTALDAARLGSLP